MITLQTDIKFLKGIGEKRAALFKKLQIETIEQLLYYFPRSYLDLSNVKEICDCKNGETCVIKARVFSKGREQRIRAGLSIFKVGLYDDSGNITATFFNSKYSVDALNIDEEYLFYGKISGGTITAPQIYSVENGNIIPIYPLTSGITSKNIASAVKASMALINEELPDPIPQTIREKYSLCNLHYALTNIHFAKDMQTLEMAKKRLIFEELFILALSLATVKSRNHASTSYICETKEEYLNDFYSSLPFEATNAQKKAILEICSDMKNKIPMNRLLQGDVGSGKTLAAAAAIYVSAKNKFQSAMMAPTEILARQHYDTLCKFLEPLGVKLQLLTGSMTAKEKRIAKERISSGEIDVVIGTHAIISDDVVFSNLALVVTDEQHRFGVAQRAKLSEKSQNPHTLVMSATPIPRTLALMIYGDLDVSILDELPPGRQKIQTILINSKQRKKAYNFIKEHLDKGLQAYIVCPLIENGEAETGLLNAVEYAENISKNEFCGYRVGLLHGKMKAKEKDLEMEKFKNGEIDVLVSTTVIEVGVDVPNSVIMMIENSERFGLSQLHQLRGRVGRGTEKSTCILVSDSNQENTKERLEMMTKSSNGFEIAEFDLKTRGPGDFLGMRQHGLPQLKIADMSENIETMMYAQEATQAILAKCVAMTEEEHKQLQKAVRTMLKSVGDRPN